METVLATLALGIIAKFVEFKLDGSMNDKEWINVENLESNKYSLKNVETF